MEIWIICSNFAGRHRVGSFRFQVSDDVNQAGNGKTYTFNIRVKDLAIHLERHDSLDVFPMMQATLRPDNLFVSTSDKDSSRPITFLVKKPPKMGRLLLRLPNSEQVCFLDSKLYHSVETSKFYCHSDYTGLWILIWEKCKKLISHKIWVRVKSWKISRCVYDVNDFT